MWTMWTSVSSCWVCQGKKSAGAGKVLPGNMSLDKESKCCAVALGEAGFAEVPRMDM